MKVAMLVEDRDLAYLFLDTEKAEPTAGVAELTLDGVFFCDIEDEDLTIWLSNGDYTKFRVIPSKDFCNELCENDECPIPTPVVVMDNDEYERRLAE